MWYYRARLWFSVQVLLFNCCLALPVMVFDPMYGVISFLTLGFILSLVIVGFFFKQERFVILNLGISRISLILFAWVFQLIVLFVAVLLLYLYSLTWS